MGPENLNGTEEVVEKEEGTDGLENENGAEGNADGHVEGDGENLDGAGEGGTDGEAGDQDAGEPEQEVEVDPRDAELAELRAKIEAHEQKLNKPAEPASPAPLSDEAKRAICEKAGVENFQTVEFFNNQITDAFSLMKNYIDGKFVETGFDGAISQFAKSDPKFKDAGAYAEGIKKYASRYDVRQRNDPRVLEGGYYYAKGLGADQKVKKVIRSNELNRKIVRKSAMNPPKKSEAAGKGGSKRLNQSQIEAMKISGMNEKEYMEKKGTTKSKFAIA